MPQNLMFVWRHTAHVLVGMAVAWLVARYPLHVSQPLADWADAALFGAGVATYGYVQHWLETREGDSLPARMARGIARWMVLGAPAVPLYAPAGGSR